MFKVRGFLFGCILEYFSKFLRICLCMDLLRINEFRIFGDKVCVLVFLKSFLGILFCSYGYE